MDAPGNGDWLEVPDQQPRLRDGGKPWEAVSASHARMGSGPKLIGRSMPPVVTPLRDQLLAMLPAQEVCLPRSAPLSVPIRRVMIVFFGQNEGAIQL